MSRALVLLLAASACAPGAEEAPEPTPEELADELGAQGPYAVGYRQLQVTYRPVASDVDRTLPLEVWYPATASDDDQAAVYRVAGIVSSPSPHALLGATVADDGPFPVAVYSHGSGGLGLLAYPYAERFASHGWLVVAPDHLGNTSLDLLGGGGDPFVRNALQRPQDISAVLDAIEAGLDADLTGAGTTEEVFLWGHSFGGYTTMASSVAVDGDLLVGLCPPDSEDPNCVLLRDPDAVDAFAGGNVDARIDALGPQAPALIATFEPDALASLDLPMLLMSGKRDRTTTDEEEAKPLWDATRGADDVWLRIPDGGHYTFISICDDLGPETIALFQPDAASDGCGGDFLPTLEALPVLTTYMLAFARQHVLGEVAWGAVFDVELNPGINVVDRP